MVHRIGIGVGARNSSRCLTPTVNKRGFTMAAGSPRTTIGSGVKWCRLKVGAIRWTSRSYVIFRETLYSGCIEGCDKFKSPSNLVSDFFRSCS